MPVNTKASSKQQTQNSWKTYKLKYKFLLRDDNDILNYSDEKKLNIDTIELLKVTSTQAGVDWIELEWIYENDNVDFYQISCSHNGITIDYRIEGMDLSDFF